MDDFEAKLFRILSEAPNTAYVTPDGRQLYCLANDGLMRFDAIEGNFNDLDEAGINEYIQDAIKQILSK